MKSVKRKVAAFDIDGTIFRSSLLIEFVDGLVGAGIFSEKIYKEVEDDYLAWLNRVGHYDNYIAKVIKVFDKNIAGVSVKESDKVVKKVLSSEGKKVYRFTRDLIKKFKEKGYYLIAISGSPIHMVLPFSQLMGFDIAFGIVHEAKDGKYTGKVLSKPSSNKAKFLKEYSQLSGLKINWKKSFAVGDSSGDIPLLKIVGNPIAFNPDSVLAHEAKKRDWPIIVERKDVVYGVKDFRFVPYEGYEVD